MDDSSDPRVFFAAERTLLAWIRTGLTVMGLGFVVARFGLFLQLVGERGNGGAAHPGSTFIGVALLLLGSTALGLAAWQHVRFCRALRAGERPHPYWTGWAVWYALALAIVGVVLAAYLLMR